MKRRQKPHYQPSAPSGNGVRIIPREPSEGRWRRWASLLVPALAVGVGVCFLFHRPQAQKSPAGYHAEQENRAGTAAPSTFTILRARMTAPPGVAWFSPPGVAWFPQQPQSEQEPPEDTELPSRNPDDVASYVSPNDPAPTMAEVIAALHGAGIYEGLGAFNPPGTSPPLQGLAVPEDFQLPEGYVRHHQVTDEGEPIEPILMFSPDFEFYDASGKLVKLPPDRVVPPELAPPGMPIVQIRIPSPQ
jgi:hypothetical protein